MTKLTTANTEAGRISAESRARTRPYRQYLFFRLLVVLLSGGLIAAQSSRLRESVGGAETSTIFSVLGAYLLFAAATWVGRLRGQHTERGLRSEVTVDFGIQLLLVWLTGGVLSILNPVFFVTLAAATAIIRSRDCFVAATLLTLGLACAGVAQMNGLGPSQGSDVQEFTAGGAAYLTSHLIPSGFGLFAIAGLGSSYARRLRGMKGLRQEIAVAERRIERLENLQVMALGIAHEIRNPLASIRGCVQELGNSSVDFGHRERTFMDIICRESDRLDETLEEFLRYARPEPVVQSRFDLREVITETVTLLRARDDLAGRQVEWDAPGSPLVVHGSRNRLLQLLLNLGLNALEATDPEGGRTWVEAYEIPQVDDHAASGEVEIVWGDNGNGMSEETQRQLFTPFFTTKATGNGLGLCIVDQIVDEHRGVIEVTSGSTEVPGGRGTVFRIRLPTTVPVLENFDSAVLTARVAARV